MARVLLVRHGETTWNRESRVQGWAPSPLTERGHDQAEALAGYLADEGIDRVVASDLRRCQETTRHVDRTVDVRPRFVPDWRERDFGCMQGLTKAELFGEYPQFALSAVGYPAAQERPDSGETVLELRTRVLSAWERLRESLGPSETALVVAHGGPIRVVLGAVAGRDLVETMVETEVDNCGITEIDIDGEEAVLRRESETGFLPDELVGSDEENVV